MTSTAAYHQIKTTAESQTAAWRRGAKLMVVAAMRQVKETEISVAKKNGTYWYNMHIRLWRKKHYQRVRQATIQQIKEAGGIAYEELKAKRALYQKQERDRYQAKYGTRRASKRMMQTEKELQLGLCRRARGRGRKRGLEATIQWKDITWPTHCPVLGIELNYWSHTIAPNCPSLDRLDNTKGYIPGNVFVISLRANQIKSNATAEELKAVAAYAARELGVVW